jgi:DNA-binding MarR family transcriptional regulator
VYLDAGDRLTLAGTNLTPTQFTVLQLIDPGQGERLTRLSQLMMLAKSTITRLIDQLEEAGYVQRDDDPDDRRAQRVVLTASGRELRLQTGETHHWSLERRFQVLDEGERQRFASLLYRLREGLRLDLEAKNCTETAN